MNILAVCVAAIAGWWGIIINAVPVCSEEFAVTGSELGKEDRVLARQKGSSVSAERHCAVDGCSALVLNGGDQ